MSIQQKFKALERLKSSGIDDEKKLQNLDMDMILEIKGITVSELKVISEIKKNVKANRLFSYLLEEENIRGDREKTYGAVERV